MREEFASFEAYWHALTRDPDAFNAVYQAQRQGKRSNTAKRIARFEAPLAHCGVLRTNACALPSKRWSKLSRQVQRDQSEVGLTILRTLVEICRPVAILAHGAQGMAAVSHLFGVALDPYHPLARQSVKAALAPGMDAVRLFACPHLSGMGVAKGFAVGRMGDDLEALGRTLASSLPAR